MLWRCCSIWFLPTVVVCFLTVPDSGYSQNAGGDSGLDASIQAAVQPFLKQQQVAGAVTLVTSPTKVLHVQAHGTADLESGRGMSADDIFWIASMTKPVTGVAVGMLMDEGKLQLNDPVSKYLPEFKNLKNEQGEAVDVTILQLMTHTSGLQDLSAEELARLTKLSELVPLVAARPVLFEPGSRWKYCQTGINTAARIVEVLSGKSFDDFLQQRLFSPLGMKDTTFYLSEEQATRLATSYRRSDAEKLEATANRILYGKSPTSRDRMPAANGGLFSTAEDYGRFCRMLLNEGTSEGKKILQPETVRALTSLQTPPEIVTGFTPGNGWGVGFCVVREPQGVTELVSPGTFGHGGAYGTQAWIDPQRKLAWVLMVQRANFPNADASELRQAFQRAILSR